MASVVSLKASLYLVGHPFHCGRFARRGTLRYRLSSTVTDGAESASVDRAMAEGTAAALAPSANGALGEIIRHGQGDAYITLSKNELNRMLSSQFPPKLTFFHVTRLCICEVLVEPNFIRFDPL